MRWIVIAPDLQLIASICHTIQKPTHCQTKVQLVLVLHFCSLIHVVLFFFAHFVPQVVAHLIRLIFFCIQLATQCCQRPHFSLSPCYSIVSCYIYEKRKWIFFAGGCCQVCLSRYCSYAHANAMRKVVRHFMFYCSLYHCALFHIDVYGWVCVCSLVRSAVVCVRMSMMWKNIPMHGTYFYVKIDVCTFS